MGFGDASLFLDVAKDPGKDAGTLTVTRLLVDVVFVVLLFVVLFRMSFTRACQSDPNFTHQSRRLTEEQCNGFQRER